MLKKNSLKKHFPPREVSGIIPLLGSLTTRSDVTSRRSLHPGLRSPCSRFSDTSHARGLGTVCPEFPQVTEARISLRALGAQPPGTRSPLTSTSPVRSLYLSRMTGRAGFSLSVLERSLKGCSKAGEGEERLISLSPRLRLLLCDPGEDGWHKGADYSA